jgi:alpha-mannosidase
MHSIRAFILTASLIFMPLTAPAGGTIVNGYARDLTGEHLGYRSFHPYATTSLLTRCLDGTGVIRWETDPVPANTTSDAVTFVWVCAHSSGTSTADATFQVSIDGKDVLRFTTVKGHRVRQWNVRGKDGVALAFDAQWEDGVHDLYGYMHLTVPMTMLRKGLPATIGISGEAAHRRDWYMTFMYAIRDSIAVQPQPALLNDTRGPKQLIDVLLDIIEPASSAKISVPGQEPTNVALKLGYNQVQFAVNAVSVPTSMQITVERPGHIPFAREIVLAPVPRREFWILHHSHNDIGYSDLQVDVEKKQVKNLRDAMALYRKTRGYPEEARFRWNSEIMWAVQSFMHAATNAEKKEFIAAVKEGGIGLDGFYTNPLTGLCRPEELVHLTDYARTFAAAHGVKINDAMITDIPGGTWATVAGLAQGGISYFSSGPNYMPGMVGSGDRVGHFNQTWGDRPFYWVSASGQEKVLVWVAGHGYSAFHGSILSTSRAEVTGKILAYCRELDDRHYPYDMVQLRYTAVADNGPTDAGLPDFVKSWNERYLSPKLVIATTSALFEEFERRWGSALPSFAGDITPYWEDGALSTFRELALVRRASERLVQADILPLILGTPVPTPNRRDAAWRAVNLADEHTWGAHNSVSEPDAPFAVEQWRVKKEFMTEADSLSRALFADALGASAGDAVDVVNTASWVRTGIVILSREQSTAGDLVLDPDGRPVPSQRLAAGELAFLAKDISALGASRYAVLPGPQETGGNARVNGSVMSNGLITAEIDRARGAIASLKDRFGREYVKPGTGLGLNQYLYVPGKDPSKAQPATVTRFELVDNGPLVATVRVTLTAPGCRSLVQEYRIVDGLEHVTMLNTMDREKVREKEAVHFAFPAEPSNGAFRMDGGWGIVRPGADQLPGSCVEFFASGRWLDLSSQERGITWTTIESPLVQLGAMVDESPDANGRRQWKTSVPGGSTFYSYVMNNYWHTNFAADQPGPASIAFALYPHGIFNAVDAYQRGVDQNQPLIVRTARPLSPLPITLFSISAPGVAATSICPSRDGNAVMVRLFNCGGKPEAFTLAWKGLRPSAVWRSSVGESKDAPVDGPIALPAFGVITLRCEK